MRIKREKGIEYDKNVIQQESLNITDDESDDDEQFFDLSDDEIEEDNKVDTKSKESSKPEGRLKRLGKLKLLDSTDTLYIPVTQEIVPKTEDQLQDDADNVLKMGSDSEFITDMMCTTVVSDSEAFKAANPSARFEDFIRWYSPNDWEQYTDEESDVVRYRLSARMQAPGNTWQTVWNQANPVPVSRQKRLFDDTQEGYKILNYLETRHLGEVFALTIVPLLHSAILKLKNILSNANVFSLFNEPFNEILADLSRFSRDVELIAIDSSNETEGTKYGLLLPDPQTILKKIEQIESHFYQYHCFAQMKGIKDIEAKQINEQFQEILQNQWSCSITKDNGNPMDFLLRSLFQEDMPEKLISKDYIIRMGGLLSTRHAMHERVDGEKLQAPIMPQYLRAIVTGEKLRLCGAFTEHTTFLD